MGAVGVVAAFLELLADAQDAGVLTGRDDGDPRGPGVDLGPVAVVAEAAAGSLTGPWTFTGTGNWAGWGSGLEGPALVQHVTDATAGTVPGYRIDGNVVRLDDFGALLTNPTFTSALTHVVFASITAGVAPSARISSGNCCPVIWAASAANQRA